MESHSYTENYRQLLTAGNSLINSYPIKSGQPRNYKHTSHSKWAKKVVAIFLCIYMCMRENNNRDRHRGRQRDRERILKTKGDHQFGRLWKIVWEVLGKVGRRTGKGEVI